MNTKTWFAMVATAALAVSCGKKKDDGGGTATGSGGAPVAGNVTINGSGSTFQKTYQESAIEAFTKANGNIKINYQGGGSGKGRKDLSDMVVDFAGSDSAFKDADLAAIKGGDILYFPVLLG